MIARAQAAPTLRSVSPSEVNVNGVAQVDDPDPGAESRRRRFVLAPERLRTLDTSCAARIPHVHTPGA
jgi:hypothetical protein